MVAKSSAAKTRKHESKDDSGSSLPDVRAAKPRAGAPEALDRLIHERLRLGIVSALAANESLTFNNLKNLMHITDGNLSVHARKLEEAGYISCNKYFEGRMPKTEYKLTSSGRRALEGYLSHMESLIKQMRGR
ncbi:MAG TPA: transcriptional regulator [Pyrinomonadaceae bacterium]|jgi:DNA-binding HxlR family transcriptional regulator|nr:transcriptional regulator [Pyrinomonadaceae bacterium]